MKIRIVSSRSFVGLLVVRSILLTCIFLGEFATGAVNTRAQEVTPSRRTLVSSPRQVQTRRQAGRTLDLLRRRRAALDARRLLTSNVLSTTFGVAANVPPHPEGASEAKDESYEDPKWRLNWFLFQRTFPYETLPSQGRFNAFTETPSIPGPSPQATPPGISERWRPIGPAPITPRYPAMGVTGGRLSSIAISPNDPQLVLVGSATGGIWRSTDGGISFAPVSDNQVDLAVGAISFAPSNPSIVYAGMGDVAGGYMGTGVLKSLNGGQTWISISDASLPAPGTISKVIVDPIDPDRLYITQFSYRAATGEGEVYASGLFVSSDGGRSWRKTFTGLPRDLVHHPTNQRTLYLSMSTTFGTKAPSAGVYRSTDGGETWQSIFVPSYLEATDVKIAVTAAEPDRIFVLTGLVGSDQADVTLHVSRDGGANWTVLEHSGFDIGQFGYNSYIAVDPTDAQKIYVGTRDLYKSTDGGTNWRNITGNWYRSSTGYNFSPVEAISHSDQHALSFSPIDPNVIYIGNDGGLSRSADGGDTFASLNATLPITQFNSITVHPSEATRACGGTQDNGALVRGEGTVVWREFVTGDSGRCLMNPLDPTTIFSSYVFGKVLRFRKNGNVSDGTIATEATFNESTTSPRIGFYPAFTIDPSSGFLYFGTWRLFVSADEGNHWKAPAGIKDLTHGITTYGPDVLTTIGLGPVDSGVIYTGSAQGRVMVSRNAGKNWKEVKNGLPKRFITSINVSPIDPDKAILTVSGFASGHVFRTKNGGASWEDISAQLPNIPVNTLLVDPLNPVVLYAGTDVGVYRSTDEGANWHKFNNGLPPVIVTGFSAQSSGTIQLATFGRGAYELIRQE